jgi:hypothetical protein
MFARTVRMQLKPNNVPQFTETMEKDVIPVLRQQPGFKDEVTFLPADGSREAVACPSSEPLGVCEDLSNRQLRG